jgi:NADH-quinone oxidoreductase subunit K
MNNLILLNTSAFSLNNYVMLSFVLFAIGIVGVMTRRNAIVIFMCIEIMLNSVNLLLAAFSKHWADPNGQVFVFFIMVVAAAEVVVGLAILVMIYRNLRTTDINELKKLKF